MLTGRPGKVRVLKLSETSSQVETDFYLELFNLGIAVQ